MSFDAIEQKAKSVLEAYYELERLKMKNSSKTDLDKQKSFIISLVDGIKKDSLQEKA